MNLALLNEDGPALLRGALDASWSPALLLALRRALPSFLAVPGPERVEFLRAAAAAEEPRNKIVSPGETMTCTFILCTRCSLEKYGGSAAIRSV
ncbi:hypothetical protein AB0C27_55930 [Nonomuraea sp. NPDC048882]|uniref:hypothetical protein n=1 Tax=Nonomuraea sp. NPDC048882 TaxID=3154347 RepID=UPI0033C3E69D